jgi:endonuclease/exonuclease/phosphatase family metal-dependent hydrolase
MKKMLLIFALLLVAIARAETITVATYNIELFHERFAPTTQPINNPDLTRRLRADADKNLWLASQVILDPKLNPDIICIEECCEQAELDKFNKDWLKGAYETVIVFPTNSERHQQLAMMLKSGFKVIERKDQYYLEKDTGQNDRGDRLFARGPVFCLVQAPSGYQFWVGVTHGKSKRGNNVDVAKWRNREATRLHEICKEIESTGKGNGDVLLVGDMNDELGFQEYEQQAGGDSIALTVGPPEDGFVLATKPLIDAGKISFGGYWRPQFRAFIDQIILSKAMKDQVREVNVFQDGLARAASDHYPVYIRFNADPTN